MTLADGNCLAKSEERKANSGFPTPFRAAHVQVFDIVK
jgi:hypothetical protein